MVNQDWLPFPDREPLDWEAEVAAWEAGELAEAEAICAEYEQFDEDCQHPVAREFIMLRERAPRAAERRRDDYERRLLELGWDWERVSDVMWTIPIRTRADRRLDTCRGHVGVFARRHRGRVRRPACSTRRSRRSSSSRSSGTDPGDSEPAGVSAGLLGGRR